MITTVMYFQNQSGQMQECPAGFSGTMTVDCAGLSHSAGGLCSDLQALCFKVLRSKIKLEIFQP